MNFSGFRKISTHWLYKRTRNQNVMHGSQQKTTLTVSTTKLSIITQTPTKLTRVKWLTSRSPTTTKDHCGGIRRIRPSWDRIYWWLLTMQKNVCSIQRSPRLIEGYTSFLGRMIIQSQFYIFRKFLLSQFHYINQSLQNKYFIQLLLSSIHNSSNNQLSLFS